MPSRFANDMVRNIINDCNYEHGLNESAVC